MRTIFKYPLEMTDIQEVAMPLGARVLYVGNQDGVLCLWACVDTDKVKVTRVFQIVGTGHPMPTEVLTHIGSVIVSPFVWHVFELKQ